MKTAIKVELSLDEASALAQLCKRIGYTELRANSTTPEEAYSMLDAVHALADALAAEGHRPR